MDNLIRSSKMRQAAFRKEENLNLESLAYPSADKQFLQSIIDSIEQHFEEPKFDLEQLAAEKRMSKSTLYRKIKSMTGMTPLDFIRNIKMKRACMMLLSGSYNISEVAYAVASVLPSTSPDASRMNSVSRRANIFRNMEVMGDKILPTSEYDTF